jgi:hypothetical protein
MIEMALQDINPVAAFADGDGESAHHAIGTVNPDALASSDDCVIDYAHIVGRGRRAREK